MPDRNQWLQSSSLYFMLSPRRIQHGRHQPVQCHISGQTVQQQEVRAVVELWVIERNQTAGEAVGFN
jgi:hypothetical protein